MGLRGWRSVKKGVFVVGVSEWQRGSVGDLCDAVFHETGILVVGMAEWQRITGILVVGMADWQKIIINNGAGGGVFN